MNIDELKTIAREAGVVGAGGAGFPSYAKLSDKADTVILNCAECEPLLKLHNALLKEHASEILEMLNIVRETIGAKEAVIGIKAVHEDTIGVLEQGIKEYPQIRICALKNAYPMGDEVVLIYEATGRVISPGGLPIEQNVVVFNVETMYNMYRASFEKKPVTHKLVSIVGEIDHPQTVRLPLGTTVKDAINSVGKITTDEPAFVMGGPMMGRLGFENTLITKTTNAIIILPKSHKVVMRMKKSLEIEKKRAASSCCQCRTCTDLCPRHALGHPIEPHKVMRAIANQDTSDLSVYMNTAFCSSCGLCENYSCPQGLSPRSMIAEFKSGLRAAGIKPDKPQPAPVAEDRNYRMAPVEKLKMRLDLSKYDVPAPMDENPREIAQVKIPISQHIGAPAVAAVKEGDKVKCGDVIARAADGLSVNIHASIDGTVSQITGREIVISR